MKRILLAVFILVLFEVTWIFAISIDGGSYQVIVTADKDTSGKSPDQYQLMHEARISINGSPNRYLEIRNEIKSSWLPRLEGSQTDDVSLFDLTAWKTILYYKPSYQLQIGFGNIFVNYSPYFFHAEEWQDAFFKGVFGQIKEDNLDMHLFLGFHTESKKTNVVSEAPGIKNLGFFYKQRNYHNSVEQEPTHWGGLNISYTVADALILKLAAGHENYSITEYSNGASGDYFLYANEIIQPEIFWKPVSWIDCHLLVAGYFQSYQAFYGMWDYFGPGKHLMVLNYTGRNLYPAGESSIELRNPLGKHAVLATSARILYRYIDKHYQPVHLNNGAWDENRGEDFMDFLAINRKGWIFSLTQPVFKILSVGSEFRFFNSIDNRISQEDYRVLVHCHDLFSLLTIDLVLRSQMLAGAAFVSGDNKLLSAFLKAGITEKGKWTGEVSISINDRDRKNFDQFQFMAKFYF